MRLWFKQDNYFLRPKLQLKFSLSSPLAYVDPLHSNYTRLFVDLLKDSLTEVVYDAELAGMAYTFNNTIYGVDVRVFICNARHFFIIINVTIFPAVFGPRV
jgi:insulysin